jgi:hypothetical protein
MSHREQREASRVLLRKPLCTVMTVKEMDCRWVTDYVTLTGFAVFCGKPALKSHRPYCEDHYPLVYVRQEKRR